MRVQVQAILSIYKPWIKAEDGHWGVDGRILPGHIYCSLGHIASLLGHMLADMWADMLPEG